MEESEKDNDGSFIDPWFNYSPWERECLQHLEAEPDVEARLLLQKQAILDSLWASFQNAAKSVAQLYKGKLNVCFSLERLLTQPELAFL